MDTLRDAPSSRPIRRQRDQKCCEYDRYIAQLSKLAIRTTMAVPTRQCSSGLAAHEFFGGVPILIDIPGHQRYLIKTFAPTPPTLFS